MVASFLMSIFAIALAAMIVFPRTPAAKVLHRILVEAPLRFVHEMSWKKFGQVVLSAAALCLMMAMGPEMLLLMASMGLDAAFVEVLILLYLTSTAGGFISAWRSAKKAARRLVSLIASRFARITRSRRCHRRKVRQPGKKDKEPEPGWAFA